jgi:hypothetical protein
MSMNMNEMVMRLNIGESVASNVSYERAYNYSVEKATNRVKQFSQSFNYGIKEEYTESRGLYQNREFRLSYLTTLQEQMELKFNELKEKIEKEIEKEIEYNNRVYQEKLEAIEKEVRVSIIRNKHKELADKFDIEKVNDLPKDVVEYIIKPYVEVEYFKSMGYRIKHWLFETDKLREKVSKINYTNLTIIARSILYSGGKNKQEKIDNIITSLKSRFDFHLKNEREDTFSKQMDKKYYLLFNCLIMIFPTYKKKINISCGSVYSNNL